MITASALKAFAPKCLTATFFAEVLESARLSSTVKTPRRLCHFMGQVFVETAGFTTLEENLNYRDPVRLDAIFSAVRGVQDAKALIKLGPSAIANRVYANRLGNGPESSGDGWMFRGSGFKQLTGRANFREFGRRIGTNLEANPESARQPAPAAAAAFAYWDACNCSAMADDGDLDGITAAVNGPAKLGLRERREAVVNAMRIWG